MCRVSAVGCPLTSLNPTEGITLNIFIPYLIKIKIKIFSSYYISMLLQFSIFHFCIHEHTKFRARLSRIWNHGQLVQCQRPKACLLQAMLVLLCEWKLRALKGHDLGLLRPCTNGLSPTIHSFATESANGPSYIMQSVNINRKW